ncbi:MAG: DUF262 domain-containing protein [Chromatiaceae bacterium]|nr:DUF262 domain-containing protein [Chromatiaceae bacterium]
MTRGCTYRAVQFSGSTSLIGVDTLHIIDGQQRLTTLQFVLKAAKIALKSVNATSISEIIASTLINSNPDTMRDAEVEKYKVWPTFRDRDNYKLAFAAESRDQLMHSFPDSFTQRESLRKIGINHPSPLEAIWFFSGQFEQWIKAGEENEVSLRSETLATSILQDLKVVSIVLDKEDDAQVIFETLNGRGAQLHATDLIRNYIFMRADQEGENSKQLYDGLRSPFEKPYWNEVQRRGRMSKPRVEWFVHSFLQAIMQEDVDLGRLYFEYRRFVFSDVMPRKASNQLTLLARYSELYKKMMDRRGAEPISALGRRIAPFEVTTLHPLALFIGASEIGDDEKASMYELLVSYIVRRQICGLTPKNYNNVFSSLLKGLSKSAVSPSALRELLGSLAGEASRWPRDEEFRNACETVTLFPGRLDSSRMRAVLSELEFSLRESSRTEDPLWAEMGHLDVEHVLPQSWYAHWPLPDGDMAEKKELSSIGLKQLLGTELNEREKAIIEREEKLKTLGNLTLLNLSVNREAQNKEFSIKKRLLLENTNLRLNIPLLAKNEWNEMGIKERGKLLAIAALSTWPGIKAEQGAQLGRS